MNRRTMLADFFSILLEETGKEKPKPILRVSAFPEG